MYLETNLHDLDLLKSVTDSITECGPISIKFCQWITPKLELIYLEDNDILNENKPDWLLYLEKYYEKCPTHDIHFTKEEYKRVFHRNIEDDYTIDKILGSGSIGQVYLVTNKLTQKQEVIKILHPKVNEQVHFFRRMIQFLLWFPCIHNKCNELFPFDIYQFIDQFEEQTNLLNEANHLLYFYEEYKNNDLIVIPRLYKISPSILIMSYEDGVSFGKSILNEYQKYKLIHLYHLFIRNNQIIKNYNHGDLHPGNWKIRVDNTNNNHKLVIYDYGYCWSISHTKFKRIVSQFVDTFEESNKENSDKTLIKLCKLMYLIILYDGPDKETDYKIRIKEFLTVRLEDLQAWKLSPISLLKTTIDFCIQESLLLDPILVQCFIILIQSQKLLEKYGMQSTEKNVISDYEVFRERYINDLTFCKTYNIFKDYSNYIEQKLNDKQLKVDKLFDTINLDDSLKELALLPK